MTVPANRESRAIKSASGFANPISLDQYVEAASHVEVYADTTLMSLGVDYTLSGLMDNDGLEVTITPTGLASYDPSVYVVFHNPPIDQDGDLSLGGRFGKAFEDVADRLARRLQAFDDRVRRGLRLPINTPLDIEGGELPSAAPDQIIGWNAAGDGLENKGTVPQLVTIAGIAEDIAILSPIAAEIIAVAAVDDDVAALGSLTAQIAALGALTTEIVGVYNIRNNVTTVAGISGNVTTVAGISGNVATVAGISGNVTTVAGISAAVSTVASNIANITTTATISGNITTVAGISSAVTTVAGNNAAVSTVATNIASVVAAAADIPSLAAKLNITGSNIGANGATLRTAIGLGYANDAEQTAHRTAISAAKSTPDAILEHQEVSGTNGGTVTSGSWATLTLNAEASDPNNLITLSSNAFTPTVNMWMRAQQVFHQCDGVKIRLYNVTDSTVVKESLNVFLSSTAGQGGVVEVAGELIAGKQYRLEYRVVTTKATTGQGVAFSLGTEIYTSVYLWRR